MDLLRYKVLKKEINLIEIIIFFVCLTSVINIFFLLIGVFYPLYSLLISFILLILFLVVFGYKIKIKDARFCFVLLIILFVSLFLRVPPNLYLAGGQDQGTYVSLSKQYEINHSLYIKDELRNKLSKEAKILYDKSGAATMLGVEELDLEESVFYMPFYPVFPSWMSSFGSLFGSDNRIYALTMFSILSIIGVYLLGYEISGRRKEVGLLSSFLLAINPLHVYFSRIPLTEIVSLCFFIFSLYYLIKFYNDYKEGKRWKISFSLSILSATVLFFTRMSALIYAPIIISIPVVALLFSRDKKLTKYLSIYSILWSIILGLSYLYYKIFLPDLFMNIFEGRILNLAYSKIVIFVLLGLLLLSLVSIVFENTRIIVKKLLLYLHKYLSVLILLVFVGLILYELGFYVIDIFINNNYSFFSFESLSYLKQLNTLATFLYLSPIGFILLPLAIYYYRKKKDIRITILLSLICIFLIYCWGIIKFSPYHYYFVRYQLSELIPLCTILISIFLVDLTVKRKGKVILIATIIFSTLYFGYFSLLQLRDFEGANPAPYEELQEVIKKEDLLLVAGNNFESSQQIVFPMKYYYGINTFIIYTSTYIDYKEIKELKNDYQNIYLLMTNPDFEQKGIKLVKEIDFEHNYFVHCNRDKDAYFKMESHSPDIPFCEYIIIPNRYYHGTFKMYLYSWE